MRISDWSSDVCSSDLPAVGPRASRLARPRCDPLGAGRLRNADSGVLRQQVDSGRNTWPSLDLACILQVEALTAPSRSEEHTSELQSLMRISYAVFCLKKKNKAKYKTITL